MTSKKTNQPSENYLGAWTQAMDEQMGRFETTLEDLAQRNNQAFETANTAIAEWAKLARESVTVSQQMSTEWMKAVHGASLRASEMTGAVIGR